MTRTAYAGLSLAVLAEVCSVGLLGLSGWFIASSAVAGMAATSTFSYLAPSGGVRSFAMGRIVGTYAQRVVLHAAALRRVSAARLGFYDLAAAASSTHGAWAGQSLDRVMKDADTSGLALMQATTPMVVTAVMTTGGCAVVMLAGYPRTALVLVAGVLLCCGLAMATARRTDDPSLARGSLRREVVSAVDAWAEMASLGAVNQLVDRAMHHITAFERGWFRHATTMSGFAATSRAVSAVAWVAVLATTASTGASVATLVFIVLLAAGVLANAERLVPAAEAHIRSTQAERRLRSAGPEDGRPAQIVGDFHVSYRTSGLIVSGYHVPTTFDQHARQIGVAVSYGQTLVITGASGTGKSTFLDALGARLRASAGHVITSVLADDYLFSGTVAENVRLADPSASDDDIESLLRLMLLDGSGLQSRTRVGVHGRAVSGGEARRLHLARALATRPDVLIIDEPVTSLDEATGMHVIGAIRRRLPSAVLVIGMHEMPADPGPLGAVVVTVNLTPSSCTHIPPA